jgi:hypothetical protein
MEIEKRLTCSKVLHSSSSIKISNLRLIISSVETAVVFQFKASMSTIRKRERVLMTR